MKQYFFSISSVIFLLFSFCSCSEEESKTRSENAARVRPLVLAPTVKIGAQVWMSMNLNVTKYRNGDIIPQVTDPIEWATLTTGAWCYPGANSANGFTYGKLYNWYAVNDSRGLAPTGWHVATDVDWTILTTYLGGLNIAGGKMKEIGIQHWLVPNSNATNESGFSSLPAGFRNQSGTTWDIGYWAYYWSSNEFPSDNTRAYFRDLSYLNGLVERYNTYKSDGFSVRCVKN